MAEEEPPRAWGSAVAGVQGLERSISHRDEVGPHQTIDQCLGVIAGTVVLVIGIILLVLSMRRRKMHSIDKELQQLAQLPSQEQRPQSAQSAGEQRAARTAAHEAAAARERGALGAALASAASKAVALEAIAQHLTCPITTMLMMRPVMARDGHTYERRAIREWLRDHDTSPKTRARLPDKSLVRNRGLQSVVGSSASSTASLIASRMASAEPRPAGCTDCARLTRASAALPSASPNASLLAASRA